MQFYQDYPELIHPVHTYANATLKLRYWRLKFKYGNAGTFYKRKFMKDIVQNKFANLFQ